MQSQLPKYLQIALERVQKRALSVICRSLSYDEALDEAGILTSISYGGDIYVTRFLTLPSATGITNLITSY